MIKRPTIGPAYQTGNVGELTFLAWLPSSWLARRQSPDVFLDFIVEIVENGEPTGRLFGAQIKGTETGKSNATKLKYSARAKHLRYWLREFPTSCIPLFLIDTQNRSGHWLFIQRFVRDHIPPAKLEKNKKITLCGLTLWTLWRTKPGFYHFSPRQKNTFEICIPGQLKAALEKKQSELKEKRSTPRLQN